MRHQTILMRVFALLLCVMWGGALHAQSGPSVAEMLEQLADPQTDDWEDLEEQILDAWSRSGSKAMDLLLMRGQEALEADDYLTAIEHFTALTDHAPDFAEGWNMRATAFFLVEEYGLSIEDISRALALNPDHFSALNGLGIILEEIGENEAALVAYKQAFRINPHRENLVEAIERLSKLVDGTPI